MSKNHTPGPWEVFDGGEHLTISPTWGGFTICRMHELYNDETIAANARLIAAAPEMLELLTEVRNSLRAASSDLFPVRLGLWEVDELADEIDALLERARGDDGCCV